MRAERVERWGFEEKPLLLPISTENRDGYRDAYKLYHAAVRKWQQLLKWGEAGREGGRL